MIDTRHQEYLQEKHNRAERDMIHQVYNMLTTFQKLEVERLVRNENYSFRKAFEKIGIVVLPNPIKL